MILLNECGQLTERMTPLMEGTLPAEERQAVNDHLRNCAACRSAFERYTKIHAALHGAFAGRMVSPDFDETTGRRLTAIQPCETEPAETLEPAQAGHSGARGARIIERLGAAPWWLISAAFHFFVISLVSLITMAVGTPNTQELITVTNLERTPKIEAMEAEKQKDTLRDILESRRDTSATDFQSQAASAITVSPDILATAALADRFETVNPDRPDTQGAFGNPDATMFQSANGNDEAAGGGGLSGASLSEELIGAGGSNSPGTGGGWGGGNGLGSGTGNGLGHGSFGQRNDAGRKVLVMRHGGSKATESAVDKGLEWLAKHQDADGHWDAKKFDATCTEKDWVDTGMTSVAVLAFLGAGHSEKVGKYRDNVRRGIYWLLEKQKHEGNMKGAWVTIMYANGLACLALSEAYGMGKNPEVKKAAQEAVEYIQQAQHQYMAWDYYANKEENARNDTSVSGWQVMALKSAKIAGLKVDTQAFQGAMNWLDIGQELPKDMREAPSDFDGGLMAYGGTKINLEARSMSMSAAAAMMRLFMGQKTDHPGVLGPCNQMLREKAPCQLPCRDAWGNHPNSGINYYYWYYGTFAMFQMGGEHWKKWNQALKDIVPSLQRKDGDFDGSWDPIGNGRIPDGGRVFSTSLAILCLEVYYRYLPLYR